MKQQKREALENARDRSRVWNDQRIDRRKGQRSDEQRDVGEMGTQQQQSEASEVRTR